MDPPAPTYKLDAVKSRTRARVDIQYHQKVPICDLHLKLNVLSVTQRTEAELLLYTGSAVHFRGIGLAVWPLKTLTIHTGSGCMPVITGADPGLHAHYRQYHIMQILMGRKIVPLCKCPFRGSYDYQLNSRRVVHFPAHQRAAQSSLETRGIISFARSHVSRLILIPTQQTKLFTFGNYVFFNQL